MGAGTETVSLDSALQGLLTAAVSLDSALTATQSAAVSLDASITLGGLVRTAIANLDAALLASRLLTISLDGYPVQPVQLPPDSRRLKARDGKAITIERDARTVVANK
jgi:hypothetical protein